MDYTITVTGWDELIKKCNDPTLISDPLRNFFYMGTAEIQGNVMTFAPKDMGELAGSISATIDPSPMPLFGIVSTLLQPHYGPDMEWGTAPHWVPIAALIGWAYRHGMNPYAIQRKIAKYGTAPRLYFQKGAQASMGKLQELVQDMGHAIEDRWSAK